MKTKSIFTLVAVMLNVFLGIHVSAQINPIVTENVVFEEVDGIVAVEAEYFFKQSKTEVRQWYRQSKNESPKVGRDEDGQHCVGASNYAYLEILPDTRVTSRDKLIPGENYSNTPGEMTIVHYKININTPGRYYVWARAYSCGAEDNGLHVGIDGTWPETGARLQWCEGKNSWRWESKQRTDSVHCGEPHKIYLDIDKPGIHEVQFSLREDGFEFDKFILSNNKDYKPEDGVGPEVKVKTGKLPASFPVVTEDPKTKVSFLYTVEKSVKNLNLIKAQSFPIEGTDFYVNKDWLAINPNTAKEASTSITYNAKDISGDLIFLGVGENDGGSEYTIWINEKEIGSYTPPVSVSSFEEASKYCKVWENVSIKNGDKITVKAKIGSVDGKEFSRGRWSGIAITPTGTSTEVFKAMDGNATKVNVK